MAVNFSGSAFATLFFEHSRSKCDQEGFLLGKVVSLVTDTISDSQMTNTKEETVTYIYSFIPCSGLFSWYDNSGQIMQDKLVQILKGNKHKEVIGWYKFRRNSSLRVSLRERAIHQHLREAFPGVPSKNFTFFLCTMNTSENLALHTLDHSLFSLNAGTFQSQPVSIINLGDTSQSDYKLHSNNVVDHHRGMYSETVQRFQPDFVDRQYHMRSVQNMNTMCGNLHEKLMDLCNSVAHSEDELGMLHKEVTGLRDKLKWRLDQKKPKPSIPEEKSQERTPDRSPSPARSVSEVFLNLSPVPMEVDAFMPVYSTRRVSDLKHRRSLTYDDEDRPAVESTPEPARERATSDNTEGATEERESAAVASKNKVSPSGEDFLSSIDQPRIPAEPPTIKVRKQNQGIRRSPGRGLPVVQETVSTSGFREEVSMATSRPRRNPPVPVPLRSDKKPVISRSSHVSEQESHSLGTVMDNKPKEPFSFVDDLKFEMHAKTRQVPRQPKSSTLPRTDQRKFSSPGKATSLDYGQTEQTARNRSAKVQRSQSLRTEPASSYSGYNQGRRLPDQLINVMDCEEETTRSDSPTY